MGDTIRILLLLALAGSLATLAGSVAVWWRDEARHSRRMLRRALQAPPQMVIVAPGYGLSAGLNLDRRQVAILSDGGARGLIYRLDQLMGGELIVDDRVAARAYRGEPRRALDEVSAEACRVVLRLVFDNPRDPDFELILWPPGDPDWFQSGSAAAAIQSARRWLSSIEAILRQTPPAVVAPLPPPPPPPPDEEEEEDEENEPPWDEEDE